MYSIIIIINIIILIIPPSHSHGTYLLYFSVSFGNLEELFVLLINYWLHHDYVIAVNINFTHKIIDIIIKTA